MNEFKIKNGLVVEQGPSQITGSLLVSGSTTITGSLTVTEGITGSLEGTASFAISASFATDNYPLNSNPTGYLTSSFIQINPATIPSGSWSLVSGSYEADYVNPSISTSSFITFVPNNASNLEVTSCKMLPQIDSLSGSCKFYAMFPPQTDIVGQLIIQI